MKTTHRKDIRRRVRADHRRRVRDDYRRLIAAAEHNPGGPEDYVRRQVIREMR